MASDWKFILKGIVRNFSSVKLTVFLLALITVLTVPATLIQQNQAPEFYKQNYSILLSSLIILSGYDHFYTSIFFLFPVGLFWVNLLMCTIKRISLRFRKKKVIRIGPDIIHIGLLLLIVFAVLSGITRQEGVLMLTDADALRLPSGRHLILKDFHLESYPDGRPKEYLSEVLIRSGDNKSEEKSVTIEVNRPLRIDGLTIYQFNYRPSRRDGEYDPGLLVVRDPLKPFMIVSLLILISGFILTLFQRKAP